MIDQQTINQKEQETGESKVQKKVRVQKQSKQKNLDATRIEFGPNVSSNNIPSLRMNCYNNKKIQMKKYIF